MKTLTLLILLAITNNAAFLQTFPGGIKPLSTIEMVREIVPIDGYPPNYYFTGKGEVKAKSPMKMDGVTYLVSFEFNDKRLTGMNLSFAKEDYEKVLASLAKKYKLSAWDKTDAKCYRQKNIMILVADTFMACYYELELTF